MESTKALYPRTVQARIVEIPKDILAQVNPAFDTGMVFYNGLSRPATISMRSGLKVQIAPILGLSYPALIIGRRQSFTSAVNVDLRELLNVDGQVNPAEGQAILKSVKQTPRHGVQGIIAAQAPIVYYEVTKQELDKNGGWLYLHNLDIIVSIYDLENIPAHPATLLGQTNAFLEDDPILRDLQGFSFVVQIVDRARVFGDRFVNIFGTVYRVPVIQDPDLLDGVWVRNSGASHGLGSGLDIPTAGYYPFEEAKKLPWLYSTHHLAETLGNPDSQLQRDLSERKHRMELQLLESKEADRRRSVENEEVRRGYEREREIAKREEHLRMEQLAGQEYKNTLLKAELEQRALIQKQEQEIWKQRNERIALEQKNKMEWVKVVPAVIGVVGAGIALYKTITK